MLLMVKIKRNKLYHRNQFRIVLDLKIKKKLLNNIIQIKYLLRKFSIKSKLNKKVVEFLSKGDDIQSGKISLKRSPLKTSPCSIPSSSSSLSDEEKVDDGKVSIKHLKKSLSSSSSSSRSSHYSEEESEEETNIKEMPPPPPSPVTPAAAAISTAKKSSSVKTHKNIDLLDTGVNNISISDRPSSSSSIPSADKSEKEI